MASRPVSLGIVATGVAAGVAGSMLSPSSFAIGVDRSVPAMLVAGLLVGFGGGMTAASCVLRWGGDTE